MVFIIYIEYKYIFILGKLPKNKLRIKIHNLLKKHSRIIRSPTY